MFRLIFNIKRYLTRFRFMYNGYSLVTGEFGKYYAKRGSNTILFIPEKDTDQLPKSRRFQKRFATAVAEAIEAMEVEEGMES